MKPSKFAFNPLRREFPQVRPRAVKRIDPPSHHRNCAPGAREQPSYVAVAANEPLSSRLVTVRVVSCGTSMTAGKVPTLRALQQLATSGCTCELGQPNCSQPMASSGEMICFGPALSRTADLPIQ